MIGEAYRIYRLRGRPHLLCLVCDTFSMHPEDVMQKYCHACGIFLDDLPESFRRPPRTVRNVPGWTVPPANDPLSDFPPDEGA